MVRVRGEGEGEGLGLVCMVPGLVQVLGGGQPKVDQPNL